jgi:3-oxoacid CoA-transferase
MEHCDKKGNSKVLPSCTLPLTGMQVVSMIITEKAVFDVLPNGAGLCLLEHAPDETVESVRKATAANFTVADDVKVMQQ